MNYRDPGLAVPLAAAYALGTLRGAARRRFERLLEQDPQSALGDEVGFWELRLAEAAGRVDTLAPPAEAWRNIECQLDAQTQQPPIAAASATLPRRRRRHWKLAAGLAAAASLIAAFKIGQNNAETPSPIIAQTEAAPSPATPWQAMPMVVAQVQMPASSMAWLISLSPDRRQITVVAAEDFLQVGRHSVELWLRSPGRGLVPLGLLPCTRDESTTMPLPDGLEGQPEVSFTISLEPQGGSPTGQPTSSLQMSAQDRGAI